MGSLCKVSLSLLSAAGKGAVGRVMKKCAWLFQALVMAFMLLSIAAPAWAAAGISFLTDTTTLVQAIATWMLVIIPVAAGVMLAYYAVMKMMNEGDPQVAMRANHAMKNVIIAAVIGESAAGIISRSDILLFRPANRFHAHNAPVVLRLMLPAGRRPRLSERGEDD